MEVQSSRIGTVGGHLEGKAPSFAGALYLGQEKKLGQNTQHSAPQSKILTSQPGHRWKVKQSTFHSCLQRHTPLKTANPLPRHSTVEVFSQNHTSIWGREKQQVQSLLATLPLLEGERRPIKKIGSLTVKFPSTFCQPIACTFCFYGPTHTTSYNPNPTAWLSPCQQQ